MGGGGGFGGGGISHNHGRFRGKLKTKGASTGLMLTSMLDILTVMLFFLMKNFSQVQSDFAIGKDISLPFSSAIQQPVPALQLVVTKNAILLDDEKIADIINGEINAPMKQGNFIIPLAQKLEEQKKKLQVLRTEDGKPLDPKDPKSFAGTIVMQAHKDLQFGLLKKIIYTAGVQDFVMLKLAVLRKEEG